MANDERIVNKIIPIETIIEVAKYFEDERQEYIKLFEEDKRKNEKKEFNERAYDYYKGTAKVQYKIYFNDGSSVNEEGYEWFIGKINNLENINEITLFLRITYFSNDRRDEAIENSYRHSFVSVSFKEEGVHLNIDGKGMEEDVYKLHSNIKNIIEKNEERYNNTVKKKTRRIQSFCLSIGFVLSYIVYIILIVNKNNLPTILSDYLDNKLIIIIGQWIVALALGNILGQPIMKSWYKNILPRIRISHYSKAARQKIYVEDVDDYVKKDEVQIGRFTNNGKKRALIEKVYKITSKIVLLQLAISVLLYLVLK